MLWALGPLGLEPALVVRELLAHGRLLLKRKTKSHFHASHYLGLRARRVICPAAITCVGRFFWILVYFIFLHTFSSFRWVIF